MALYVWQDQAPLSAMCDPDVKSCKAKNPLITNYPGRILDCLSTKAGRNATEKSQAKLSADCSTILSIAQPPDVKTAFDSYFKVSFNTYMVFFIEFHEFSLWSVFQWIPGAQSNAFYCIVFRLVFRFCTQVCVQYGMQLHFIDPSRIIIAPRPVTAYTLCRRLEQ